MGGGIIAFITTSGMACCEKNHAERESLRATSLWLLSCTGPPNSTSPNYLMNDRKSKTVVSYHAAMKYGVKIVETKMKLLLQGLGFWV